MEVRVASLRLRLVAGLADLVPVVALAVAASWTWFGRHPPDLPPRYWNDVDYLVDLVHLRPDAVLVGPVAFASAYILWETLWTAWIGAAPVARLAGIRVISTSGRRIGAVRALIRAVLSLILAVAAGVGPAWAFLSPRRRMLHDILCACLAAVGPLPPRDGLGGPMAWAGTRLDGPGLEGPRR